MPDPHILADAPVQRVLAPIALALSFALGTPAVAANSFFAVVPVSGVNSQEQMRPVTIALASATPPAAHVGEPYEFNFGALLSLDGPEGTEPGKVTWSVVSGELPAGLALVGDRVVGTPMELAPGWQVVIRAEHPDAQGMVGAMASYSFEVSGVPIADFGGYRAWEDGTFAQNCDGYIRPADPSHQYTGATGDGVYRIASSGAPFDVYCDQSSDGGGWTLLMKQAANDGVTLQGDTTYWKNGTVLNDSAAGRSMADGNFVSPAFAQLPMVSFRLQAANETEKRYHNNPGAMTGIFAFSDERITDYSDAAGTRAPDLPNWFIHADKYPNLDFDLTRYPDGVPLNSARFGFNIRETGYSKKGVLCTCAARWGWAADENTNDTIGTHDACGGLGGWGIQYGSTQMGGDKSAWQPATLYLWGR